MEAPQAQSAKLPIPGLVDRITLWFVPAVMALAAVTVVLWLAFGPSPTLAHALVAGVAVLIIACPCAMGLATPTSIMVGTGRAAVDRDIRGGRCRRHRERAEHRSCASRPRLGPGRNTQRAGLR